jgi:dihydrofolate synthase/folylpolyglutamate synthase
VEYAAGFFVIMTTSEHYHNCLKEMYGLRRFGIKLGLSTIKHILGRLGNPQDQYNCIHVAGTNGKGSVAAMLASVLNVAGYRTGLYTSPHLVKFNERIAINNRPIANERVIQAYEQIKQVHQGRREPTFFEFTTAMALFEFGQQKVQWAVVETGMGGRLDATNVIQPALSIITNVSVEHREYLGRTIREIAGEKAGIIKAQTPVITGARQKKALSVIQAVAATRSAPVYRLGQDFRTRRHSSGTFTYYGMDHTWHGLEAGLLGRHQVDNAAKVLAACEVLDRKNVPISLEQIREGLLQTRWPGRLEIVCSDPFVMLDGAHNLAAARNLAGFLSSHLNRRDITLVIGILDDKPYRAMLQALVPVCRRVILTQPRIDRRLPAQTLLPIVKEFTDDVTVVPDVQKAVLGAIKTAGANDAVCIAGSLYVVGEAKEALEALDLPSGKADVV